MKDFEHELLVLRALPMAKPGDGPLGAAAKAIERLLRANDIEERDGVYYATVRGQERLKGPRTPCCGRTMTVDIGEAGLPQKAHTVAWNPFNGVVQCHACGEIYVPASAIRDGRGDGDFAYALWKQAGGGMESSPKETS